MRPTRNISSDIPPIRAPRAGLLIRKYPAPGSTHVSNTEFAKGTAYENGQYAIINLLATPFKYFMCGAELEYGRRESFNGSYAANDVKLQFSFKYNFSQIFYRNK